MRFVRLLGLLFASLSCLAPALADEKYDAQWIWCDSGKTDASSRSGKFWFRREVRANEPSTGAVRILCDGHFHLWVNGRHIGEGGGVGEGATPAHFNLNGIVERGPNVFCVQAVNPSGKGGLFVDGEIRGQGGRKTPFDSGPDWMATQTPPKGDAWLKPGFDLRGWRGVKLLGRHEQSAWKQIALKESYLDRFEVPQGFELVRVAPPKLVGSLVAMTWGNRGRLIVSRERGPILAAIDDNGDGLYDRVVEYSNDVKNCQGLCTVGDDLYAVGAGPKGTGVYRLPDRNHDDKADEVQLVLRARGGMGDHGPHDVVFGPDGWLYYNSGNHSWVTATPEPTSPVHDYSEDYLLVPKFEDAGGHAAGIKAPGGTIWRFTPDAKHWWCETNGFRNEYDFAFNAAGDMFAFDSDMEWDVGAYWYRPVRVNHCTAGAEFGWRSGAAKWPPFYFDSLPAAVDVGRGSPTGVIFYDHRQFPEKFRGSLIACDWSLGRILAFHLNKVGATYRGTFETVLTGNPLNVADVEVAPDGSILFVTGGRNTEGGIFRLRFKDGNSRPADAKNIAELLALPQIESAWAREIAARVKSVAGPKWESELHAAVRSGSPAAQLRALTLLNQLGPKPGCSLLIEAAAAGDAAVRAFAAHLLGFQPAEQVQPTLAKLLSDPDVFVRRRACEAFVHCGAEAPLTPLLAALGGNDRFLRFAARVALERIPRDKWYATAMASSNPHVVAEALLASYRRDRKGSAAALVETAARILRSGASLSREMRLTALRLAQLGLLQGVRNSTTQALGRTLLAGFPSGTIEVDAEAARILAVLNVDGAAAKMIQLVESAPTNGARLHFALCMRYLNAGWTFDIRRRLMEWYETTRGWEGGNSLTGYVTNVVAATSEKFTPEDRGYFVSQWRKHPVAAALIVRFSPPDKIANFERLISKLLDEPGTANSKGSDDLTSAAIQSLGKSTIPAARGILRRLYDDHPDRRESIARAIAENPVRDDWPVLLQTLQFADATTTQLCLEALSELNRRPESPEGYRTVIQTALKLGKSGGMGAVNVLRTWTRQEHKCGRDVAKAAAFYQKWYREAYPAAPAPELPKDDTTKSKYTLLQVTGAMEKTGGDAHRGQLAFAKAKCVKCHRFGSEGEGVGPDLTSLRRRFQRKEIAESIVYPSQVISDQFRMVQVVTNEGQVYTGMPIPAVSNNNKLVLLLSDTTKLEIPRKRIEEQTPSKTSVMPTGLLDPLSLQEITDLFAFLETSKFNAPVAQASGR